MRKLLFILLALPMLATAQGAVQVPYSCDVGSEFTIKIPVKLQGLSVEYVWYRNDTVVQTTPLTAGVTAISYTVPADKAKGYAVAYHFKYRLNCDEEDEWSLSPVYVVSFSPPGDCNLDVGSITIEYCGLDAGGIVIEYCELDVGSIVIEYCELDVGSIIIEHCELDVGNIAVEHCEFNAGSITAD